MRRAGIILLHAAVFAASLWFSFLLAGFARPQSFGLDLGRLALTLLLTLLMASWAAFVPMVLWMAAEHWSRSCRIRTVAPGEEFCRRCGYPVAGRASERCPECGSTQVLTAREPDLRPAARLVLTHAAAVIVAVSAVELHCTREDQRLVRDAARGFVGFRARAWPFSDCSISTDGVRFWAHD